MAAESVDLDEEPVEPDEPTCDYGMKGCTINHASEEGDYD